MRITFLGGADEVGARSLLIKIGGRRVLVDAGIRPSAKARQGLAGDHLPQFSQIEQVGGLDAVRVIHAHTDHTSALEMVAERYPDIPFYSTPITIALTRVLHQDSRRIMQTRLEEEGELPLFDDLAISRLVSEMVAVPFHTRLPLADGLVATFFPYVERFAALVRELFPRCPQEREMVIAEYACLKYCSRVGRSAAAKSLDEGAVRLAVMAHIRHPETNYDSLLARGYERYETRAQVEGKVTKVMAHWGAPE